MAYAASASILISGTARAEQAPSVASAGQAKETVSRPDQEASGAEIVVTATRRETKLQKTPVAITALDSGALARNNITDLTKLPFQVPSLYVGGNDGFGGVTVALRGIGSLNLGVGAEEGVGIYIDGVYQGKPYGDLFNFVDIDRVEVLRGPQGTLYGRNATGGAINIVTKQPGDVFAGQVNAEYTSYNGIRASAYVLVPLVDDKLGLKIAAGSDTRDGWAYNPTRHERAYGLNEKYVSASLRWRPTERTDILLSGRAGLSYNYVQQKDANDKTLAIRTFPDDAPGYDKNRYVSGSLSITQDLGTVSLVSITGYGQSKAVVAQDADLTPASIIYGVSYQNSEQETEELRLVSKNSSRFSWLVGGLYYHENSNVDLPFVLPIAPPYVNSLLFYGALKTDSYAVYGEGTYKFSQKLSFTAGGRYSYDAKHWRGCIATSPLAALPDFSLCNVSNTNPDNRNFDAFTPHFVLDYQATNDVLLYTSVTKGFRSGGWNFTDATSYHSGFGPESIWSYEGGAKTQLFNRRLLFNLAGYYADYNKLQIRVQDGPFLAVRNAGAARIYGVEFETNLRPTDRFSLSLVGAYLNAEYTEFPTQANGVPVNYSGKRLNRSPEWNITATGQYDLLLPSNLGTLTPRIEYRYTSETFYSNDNVQPLGAGPVDIVNLRLKYQFDGKPWNLTAYVDNVTNNQYRTYAILGNLPGQVASLYSDPRIFGIRAQYSW